MIIKHLDECPPFLAGDKTELRELLHAAKGAYAFRYSLAHASLPPGARSVVHRLKTAEVYYILNGSGCMHIDDETAPVRSGDAVYIPPQTRQWVENTGPEELTFLCIVDPAWRVEDEEVL
ncbi:MAG TPA: cupin domain-containing protein [Candidatus Omnitrophota bacterium]|nr:cupin domain-containing protein [Candidatus Omnitrophota bacterium]HRZ14551.1 cupin domain-containing protein [Candidatus Omnitrophota bacterium]